MRGAHDFGRGPGAHRPFRPRAGRAARRGRGRGGRGSRRRVFGWAGRVGGGLGTWNPSASDPSPGLFPFFPVAGRRMGPCRGPDLDPRLLCCPSRLSLRLPLFFPFLRLCSFPSFPRLHWAGARRRGHYGARVPLRHEAPVLFGPPSPHAQTPWPL